MAMQSNDSELIRISSTEHDIEDRTRRYFGSLYSRMQEHPILVVGAGAVGTEVVKNLVMLGVRTLHLVDFDKVSCSNLNRCVFFKSEDHDRTYKVDAIVREVRAIWPHTNIIPYRMPIQEAPDDIWSVPVIIIAVDNNEARYYINMRMLSGTETPFVINGAMGRNFLEIQVLHPGETPCLLCTWSQEYFDRLFREMVRESCDEFFYKTLERFPSISVLSSLVGGLMASEAAKILVGLNRWRSEREWEHEHIPIFGKNLRYDIRTQEFSIAPLRVNPQCVEIFCRQHHGKNTNSHR